METVQKRNVSSFKILINYKNYCAVFFLSSVSLLTFLFKSCLDSLIFYIKMKISLEFEQVALRNLYARIYE